MSSVKEKVSVLLIEDDEIDVMGVQRAFARSKLENPLIVASNGQDALDKLRDQKSVQKPYLVLLDLNMPRMNGLEFLKIARKDPQLDGMIVFVLTTSKDDSDKKQAYEHNIAGYIVKDRRENDFIDTANLLQQYTRLVEFP